MHTPAHPMDDDLVARDRAYLLHHFGCAQCIAAGLGATYGPRCTVGATLWQAYLQPAVAPALEAAQ